MREFKADIAIIGGGTGGVAAALAACELGRCVILTEETDWIGGQFTSQIVPPDENPWIAKFGCTLRYRRLREGIRDYYRRHYPLNEAARSTPHLNPGGASVSNMSHEPRVSLAVMMAALQPHLASGRLTLLLEHKPVSATTEGDTVSSVTVRDTRDGEQVLLLASYFLDATELGEVLELANVEHVIGAESQDETGEPHAVTGSAQPLNQQAVTHVLVMSHYPGENHVIDKPAEYSFWKDYQADFWPDKNLSFVVAHPHDGSPRSNPLFAPEVPGGEGTPFHLWRYRKLLDVKNHLPGSFQSDVTAMVWPQNDYWLGPLVGVPEAEAVQHRYNAKQLSLSFLYWLQTEAPRPGGGVGYPGIKLRPDIAGTKDGLAKYPYTRESRRIKAEFTILEQHVASKLRDDSAQKFEDSVGIGCYRIDLHPSTNGVGYIDIGSYPFQIPLGALIPQRVENLIPACKNIGTTHITNGCYRLHPVEWNIGEAAGALAAFCLERSTPPRAVRNTPQLLADFQSSLMQQEVELDWPVIFSV